MELALTRARPVAGDASLKDELDAAIRVALSAPRDVIKTQNDVLDMRRLMIREWGTLKLWDIKRSRGGLVDLEFIAQYLQLVHGPANPVVFNTNTISSLELLQNTAVISKGEAENLRNAATLYHRLTQVLRLCVEGLYDPAKSPDGLNRLVAAAAAAPDIAQAEAIVLDTQANVAALFEDLVGTI